MSPKKIKVGCTYKNKGAGRTMRKVIDIGIHHKPEVWFSPNPRPDEPGVLYADEKGRHEVLYLKSFASWAGAEC